MFLTSKREAIQWIHDTWRLKYGDRCVKNSTKTPWWYLSVKYLHFQFRITSIQIVLFLIFFPILLRLRCSFPNTPVLLYKLFKICLLFFYAAIFAGRVPTPSLSIFLKDLSVLKMTEKRSISYLFFISYVLCGNTVFAKTF